MAEVLNEQIDSNPHHLQAENECSDARKRPIWHASEPLDGHSTASTSNGLRAIDFCHRLLGDGSRMPARRAGVRESGHDQDTAQELAGNSRHIAQGLLTRASETPSKRNWTACSARSGPARRNRSSRSAASAGLDLVADRVLGGQRMTVRKPSANVPAAPRGRPAFLKGRIPGATSSKGPAAQARAVFGGVAPAPPGLRPACAGRPVHIANRMTDKAFPPP